MKNIALNVVKKWYGVEIFYVVFGIKSKKVVMLYDLPTYNKDNEIIDWDYPKN